MPFLLPRLLLLLGAALPFALAAEEMRRVPEGVEWQSEATPAPLPATSPARPARFRMLDLQGVCNADSRQGLFNAPERREEGLQFRRFGIVRVGEIPFAVLDPAVTGKNLIVLRSCEAALARGYARQVEIPVEKVEADALEILGGVGGWAFPCCGDEKQYGLPVVRITVQYEDGTTESWTMENGVEIADYSRPHEVPGSTSAAELVQGQQVRVVHRKLRGGVLTRLTLESFENRVAPVFVAITAEKAGG